MDGDKKADEEEEFYITDWSKMRGLTSESWYHWKLGPQLRCTLCCRRYCIWQREGPDLLRDFHLWMERIEFDSEEETEEKETGKKYQTVAYRKEWIYKTINETIYGTTDTTVEPPECVVTAVEALPDRLYYMIPYPSITNRRMIKKYIVL
jgi:hypothetical protein